MLDETDEAVEAARISAAATVRASIITAIATVSAAVMAVFIALLARS
jgi:hypothetical protein